jgi:predicted AAA+ superfamily ATPase
MSRRISKYERSLQLKWTLNPITGSGALFLWGARQTGKTTYLLTHFPDAKYYDLLDTALSAELSIQPNHLRQEVLAAKPELVIIDEIQHIPLLLEEVHWLLENTSTRFILCGSSARKLRKQSRNLLGGRAIDFHMFPLTSHEIGNVDLGRLLQNGSLPVHYMVDEPAPLLKAYVNNYLKTEIIDESVTRNVPAFTRFLSMAGLCNGEQINFANFARETGVSANTVRNYFQIMEDTLLGFTLEPWRKRVKRRLVETAKFFFFDVGIANQVHPESRLIVEGSNRFGIAFEHFVINEVRAFLNYRGLDFPLCYWRTSSGFEVDLIVGNMLLAIECKSSRTVRSNDLKGLRALADEHPGGSRLLVSRVETARKTEDGIEIMPWQAFCTELWNGGLIPG